MVGETAMSARQIGLRHSRRVDRLRFILPAIAFLLLAIVAAWPWLNGGYQGLIVPVFSRSLGGEVDPMRMQQPRYVGLTQDAEAYEVTASSAYLDPSKPDRIHLDQLNAVLERRTAEDIRLVAREGTYYRTREALDLQGDLELTFGGYRFNAMRANLDFASEEVIGNSPITGEGPLGTLAAERFDIEDGGKIMRFEGQVKVTVHPEPPAP